MLDIVLADDDPFVLGSLARRLEVFGHCVRPAADGDEVLDHVRERAPDLVITDIVMPQRDGIEVVIELHRSHPAIKLIAISGGGRIGRSTYLEAAADLGADAILAKPFTIARLFEVVAAIGLEARSQKSA